MWLDFIRMHIGLIFYHFLLLVLSITEARKTNIWTKEDVHSPSPCWASTLDYCLFYRVSKKCLNFEVFWASHCEIFVKKHQLILIFLRRPLKGILSKMTPPYLRCNIDAKCNEIFHNLVLSNTHYQPLTRRETRISPGNMMLFGGKFEWVKKYFLEAVKNMFFRGQIFLLFSFWREGNFSFHFSGLKDYCQDTP